MINTRLADKQGISEEDRERIVAIHHYINLLFGEVDTFVGAFGYKAVADQVTNLDFKLQELWGFEKNRSYHSYWFEIPTCTCPTYDNRERIGSGTWIINNSCPFHGGK